MALLPIRIGIKPGDWTIFAATLFERDEVEEESAPAIATSFGFTTEVVPEDADVEALTGR